MALSFVETEEQSLIIEKINKLIPKFMEREHQLSELGSFPYENINDLKDIGYTKLTLPKEFGGSAISLYDFVLFQEKIAEGCGATALSIGWHLGIVKELAENRSWNDEMFQWFCEEVRNGALFNRAATEPKTGSPTRWRQTRNNSGSTRRKSGLYMEEKLLPRWRQYLILSSFSTY
ncbi:Acyl-CoA dehydrogenase, short-chain specific [Bacillus thuringiensis serovar israelensis ATCC 35646]|nr:Acyl-CoA dehydrogenase, short-chain specific [Bacillus thuringiensis serovar israelensis ATCC 35646]